MISVTRARMERAWCSGRGQQETLTQSEGRRGSYRGKWESPKGSKQGSEEFTPMLISFLLSKLWEIFGWAAEALIYLWSRGLWGPGEGCWSGKEKGLREG